MSWVPRDMNALCQENDRFTTCAPASFMFLAIITRLFGQSRDSKVYSTFSQELFSPVVQTFAAGPQGPGFTQEIIFPTSVVNNFNDDLFQGRWSGGQSLFQPEIQREEYDFIVVGAGSAGCVLANRLSEVKNWKVLLLEAGMEEPRVAEVPSFAPILQKSNIDWNYMTQPQKQACLARPNRQCYWGRGKAMGGSSTINYMIYVRGNPRDYDNWEQMGNYGWSYEDVLPYFKKAEKNTDIDVVFENPEYHGQKGYQLVGRFPYQDPNVDVLIDAWNELGLRTSDINAGDMQMGVMRLQMTQHDGRRFSTNSAYIRPVRYKRRNLTIKTQAHVIRVLINSERRAFGVEYLENNYVKTAIANKEVIVSAGSLNSPKILMLSGIGPKNHLSDFGIETISDLMVGQNLQDHVTFDGLLFEIHPNITSMNKEVEEQIQDTYKYYNTGKGPLSSTGPLSCGAFVRSSYEFEPEYPDIQFVFEGFNIHNFFTNPVRVSDYNMVPLAYYDGIQTRPIVLAPRSVGYLGLNRTDPILGAPEIQPNYLSQQPDLDVLLEGIEIALKLLETTPMRQIGARLLDIPLPGCREYPFGSHSYWTCVITHYTGTIFHPAGTCKMGPDIDPEAVVDPELRVYGVKGLRVIDASIMPKVVRGNTNAPTIMIGEKGADLIKQHWGVFETNAFIVGK